VATKLGDLMEEIVIVVGIEPSLLIDQDSLSEGTDRHVGPLMEPANQEAACKLEKSILN
jgi:hypothetical protein